MAKSRRVAVLIETDDSWSRNVVAAIASYARENQWRLLIAPCDHQPEKWQGDGVLVSLRDRSMVDHVRRSGLPAVDVSIMMPKSVWLGRVATDDAARAKMAFEHFRERLLRCCDRSLSDCSSQRFPRRRHGGGIFVRRIRSER